MTINTHQILPVVLIAIDVGAGVVCALHGEPDIKRAVYWLAAAVLTWCVTF